jgi:hypothetical protein|tara:strand:- start:666 stop:851 length:186 start_codon:yes stop_codon:yes gene_type:complete
MKKSKNSSSMLTDALLNIVAEKHFDKKFDKLDMFQKNYCAKYVLNYINETDALKPVTEIEL